MMAPCCDQNCPRCGAPMEHQDDEPDVGVVGGWSCTQCDYATLDEPDDYHDEFGFMGL